MDGYEPPRKSYNGKQLHYRYSIDTQICLLTQQMKRCQFKFFSTTDFQVFRQVFQTMDFEVHESPLASNGVANQEPVASSTPVPMLKSPTPTKTTMTGSEPYRIPLPSSQAISHVPARPQSQTQTVNAAQTDIQSNAGSQQVSQYWRNGSMKPPTFHHQTSLPTVPQSATRSMHDLKDPRIVSCLRNLFLYIILTISAYTRSHNVNKPTSRS